MWKWVQQAKTLSHQKPHPWHSEQGSLQLPASPEGTGVWNTSSAPTLQAAFAEAEPPLKSPHSEG